MSIVLNPDAIWPGEKYIVCSINIHGDEVIHQSERDAERAEYSVDVFNEHEKNNARRESYYWRMIANNENLPIGRKHHLA